jgi:hypothetical protein
MVHGIVRAKSSYRLVERWHGQIMQTANVVYLLGEYMHTTILILTMRLGSGGF